MLSPTTFRTNVPDRPSCTVHGYTLKRAVCNECNAAYMRHYLQDRRQRHPDVELVARAKKRASRLGIPFALAQPITMPKRCPALGILLTPGGSRRDGSPSLDRIDPRQGYVSGNVRVVSDRANRLKGDRTADQLRALAADGVPAHRAEFALLARYVEREAVLAGVRKKAEVEGPTSEWSKLASFLNQALADIGSRHV